MITAIHLGLLVQLLAAGPQSDPGQFIRIDRLSQRVVVAYWPGIDRRCNLTAIQSHKGLVIIDTEASPRVMAPIKQKIEQTFHRTDWAYVINTHAHDNHCSGNSLFKGAVIVGHENLAEDMEWLIRRQTEPDSEFRGHHTNFEGAVGGAHPTGSLQGNGGQSLEGFVGRVDHDADGLQGRHAEQRLQAGFAENDPAGGRLAHELTPTISFPRFAT